MRNFALGLLLIAAVVCASAAEAQGGPGSDARGWNANLRTFDHPIRDFHASQLNDASIVGSSSVAGTIGINGVVVSVSMDGVSTGIRQGCPNANGTSCTSSIAALPYPAKLVFQYFDSGSNGTLACTNTSGNNNRLYGIDQFGQPRWEKIPALTEAARWETTYAYERIEWFQMQGCTAAGTTTGDLFIVAVSTDVGLPMPIKDENNIVTICRGDGPIAAGGADVAHNSRCVHGTVGTAATGLPTYLSGMVIDGVASTIDFSAVVFPTSQSAVFNTGHDFVVRGRTPR